MFCNEEVLKRFIDNCDKPLEDLNKIFSDDDFEEMIGWSDLHAFGSIEHVDIKDTTIFEIKREIIYGFLKDCIMVAVQNEIISIFDEDDTSKLYRAWLKLTK